MGMEVKVIEIKKNDTNRKLMHGNAGAKRRTALGTHLAACRIGNARPLTVGQIRNSSPAAGARVQPDKDALLPPKSW